MAIQQKPSLPPSCVIVVTKKGWSKKVSVDMLSLQSPYRKGDTLFPGNADGGSEGEKANAN